MWHLITFTDGSCCLARKVSYGWIDEEMFMLKEELIETIELVG